MIMKRIEIKFICDADNKKGFVESLRKVIDCIENDEHEIDEISGFVSENSDWLVHIDVA